MTITRRSSPRQPENALARRPALAWRGFGLVAVILLAGCSQAARSVDNVQLAVAERALEMALRNDDLGLAEDLAVSYEARVPGPEAQAFLGRVRWREGQLLEAEALSRRATSGGAPGGYVGLSMAELSRGRLAEAMDLASRLVGVEELSGYGHRVLTAVALAQGRLADAQESLLAAAGADDVGQAAAGGAYDAAAFAAVLAAGEVGWDWTGAAAQVDLRVGTAGRLLVPVTVAGSRAELQLDLAASRSTLSTRFAARAGLIPAGSAPAAVLATVQIGSLRRRLVFRVVAGGETAGVLGFDAFVDARWNLGLAPPALLIGSAAGRDPGTPFDTGTLSNTHWVRVRTPRQGLASQLLALPRLNGRVVTAGLDLSGATTVDQRQSAVVAGEDGGLVELRIGGWRGEINAAVADLYPRARHGQVAPQVLLGADFLRPWELRWTPGTQQLALRRLAPAGTPAPEPPSP